MSNPDEPQLRKDVVPEEGQKWDCIEDGERFTVIAETFADAQEQASEWGGQCIGKANS